MNIVGPVEAEMRSRAAAIRSRLRYAAPPPKAQPALPPQPTKRAAPTVYLEPIPPVHIPISQGRQLVVDTAKKHMLPWKALVGQDRSTHVVAARHEVAFRLITELGMSYPQAGRVLGGRDHTTIISSCRRYAATSAAAAETWRAHQAGETEAGKAAAHRRAIAAEKHGRLK